VEDLLSDDRLVRRIEWVGGVLLAAVAIVAWVVFSFREAFGVLLGGLIGTASFQLLKLQLKKAFRSPDKLPSKAGLFAGYYLRFIGTLFLVFVVLSLGWADPISFLVGFSTLVFGMFIVAGFEFMSMQRKKGRG
jgi:hypothetical protein